MDEQGKVFSSENLKGKIYVANFFFTRCGTICPKITSQVSRATDTFIRDKDIHFISISVDPKFDAPD
jgi:protein SCO1/2